MRTHQRREIQQDTARCKADRQESPLRQSYTCSIYEYDTRYPPDAKIGYESQYRRHCR